MEALEKIAEYEASVGGDGNLSRHDDAPAAGTKKDSVDSGKI